MASISGPLRVNPKYRFRIGIDRFNENWQLRELPPSPGSLLGAFNIRRQAVEAGFTSFANGRWTWSTSAEFSHRDYRNVLGGTAPTEQFLMSGYQLKHFAQLKYQLWRMPEKRFTGGASFSSQTGTIWAGPAQTFEKLQAGVLVLWLPQMAGDDYSTKLQIRLGRSFGQVPFDELYVLGLERENPLGMRAHLSTREGRKGNAPLGRNYYLFNWESDKKLFDRGALGIKLSPFLDIGRSTDQIAGLGSKRVLWDTGLQAKVGLVGLEFVLVYGRDLRTGRDILYLTAER
jgi:hypothetical protein